MQRNLILTKDGSHTVAVPGMNVSYHSVHGAIQESLHVFIGAGFQNSRRTNPVNPIRIFEMGFGTGLNALLTLIEAEKIQQPVHYTAVELFPLEQTLARSLNYCHQLNRRDLQLVFEQLHECEWEKEITVTNHFTFLKSKINLINFSTFHPFNLIYFDAFAPEAQPELWTREIFEKLYAILAAGGTLVTYCSKGDVRRAMQTAGFTVEKIPGPVGKREIVRARKIR
jgi:tRNA U34 5-methylaminomethyl-2-thiouridine-forming methyltransferase MnmC